MDLLKQRHTVVTRYTVARLGLTASLMNSLCLVALLSRPVDGAPDGPLDHSLDSLLNIKVNSAAKYEQTSSRAPASVSVITAEEIERFGYRTLEDVLMHVRGFYVSNDRNYSYAGVRGFNRPTDFNNRILLLLNGHTLNENVYGSAYVGSELGLSLDFIERIEVVRGPGSALYGNNAMFAVINLVTKTGNYLDGAHVTTGIGSYGLREAKGRAGVEFDDETDIAASILWGRLNGPDLYFREYDAPSTNNGMAYGLDWDKPSGFVATLRRGSLRVQGMATSRRKGIPTGAYETIFNSPDANTTDERFFVESEFASDLGPETKFMIRGYYDAFTYEGTYPYEDGMFYDASSGNWIGSEAQFTWDINPGNRLIVGTEYQNNFNAGWRAWTPTENLFNRDFPFSVISLYIQNEWQAFEKLTLTAGLRSDKVVGFETKVTPRVAAVYNPVPSSTLKLLYGTAFRCPNVYERTYFDEPTGVKASIGLTAERIQTFEAVWEQRVTEGLFAAASAYHNQVDDLIDFVVDSSDGLTVYDNTLEATARGLEIELTAQMPGGLHGSASYSLQDARDNASNMRLTNSPEHVAKVGLSYQASRHVSLGLRIVNESGRLTVQGTRTSPVVLTDFNLLVTPRIESEEMLWSLLSHLKCSLLVQNVFDADFQTPGGLEHLQAAIPQNGRRYVLVIEYAL